MAAQVTLAWDATNDAVDGFFVFQRQEGEAYDYNTPVWPQKNSDTKTDTTCTIDGLSDDRTYYFIVRACRGQNESEDSNEVKFQASAGAANTAPVAKAGADQKVKQGSVVYLDGTGSYDPDGDAVATEFTQASGPKVSLDCNEGRCSFTAPGVYATTALTFLLTVADGPGLRDTAKTIVLVTPDQPGQDGGDNTSGSTNGNQQPLQPLVTAPVHDEMEVNLAPMLTAAPFADLDGDDHHAITQWQLTDTGSGQAVMDLLISSPDQTDLQLPPLILDPATPYSVRVRYFDSSGLSSEWSPLAGFTTVEDSADNDNNGIPDDLEVTANEDLNGDGIIDMDQQADIKALWTHDGLHQLAVSVESDGRVVEVAAITNVNPSELTAINSPEGNFPLGMTVYKIHVAKPGDSAVATIYLSAPVDSPRVRWMGYDSADGYKEISDTTVMDVDGYVAERILQDGGDDDADGVANGIIIDISGPFLPGSDSSPLTSPSVDGGGGGGGGCFIRSAF